MLMDEINWNDRMIGIKGTRGPAGLAELPAAERVFFAVIFPGQDLGNILHAVHLAFRAGVNRSVDQLEQSALQLP